MRCKRVGETKRFLEPKPVKHLPEAVRLVALGETWSVTYREELNHAGLRLSFKNGKLVIGAPPT